MKLKYSFETVNMGEERIMVPVGESANQVGGVIKLNVAGLEIVELLKKEKDEEEIVSLLSDKYENGRSAIAGYVHGVIETLREHDLIEESVRE